MVAVALATALAAPAPAAFGADLGEIRSEIDARRAALSLSPVSAGDPTVATLASEVARFSLMSSRQIETATGRSRRLLREGCGCITRLGDPRIHYAERTGTEGRVAFQRWNGRWTTEQNLEYFRRSAGVLLDPRATAIEIVEAHDLVVLGVRIDPDIVWTTPFLAEGRLVRPSPRRAPTVLLPPGGPDSLQLEVRRGDRWTRDWRFRLDQRRARDLTVPTVGGALSVNLARNFRGKRVRLAYGRPYRVRHGGRVGEFATTPLPMREVRRGFHFESSLPRGRRRLFKALVAWAPDPLRRITRRIDSRMRIGGVRHRRSRTVVRRGRGRILVAQTSRRGSRTSQKELFWHEVGHAIDFIGLDEQADDAFRHLFAHSPAHRRCFRDRYHPGRCLPFEEIFADQLAMAITGRSRSVGYGVPRLADRRSFLRLLGDEFLLRPPRIR